MAAELKFSAEFENFKLDSAAIVLQILALDAINEQKVGHRNGCAWHYFCVMPEY
jgi:hypothetical protein